MRIGVAIVVGLLRGASALTASPAHAGWFSYDNYEDCMLGRMKGQDATMYLTADKACKKQFSVEFELLRRINWRYVYAPVGVVIRLDDTPDEYVITSGKFQFAEGDCAEKKDPDLVKTVTIAFVDNSGAAFDPLFDKGLFCGKFLSFRAR